MNKNDILLNNVPKKGMGVSIALFGFIRLTNKTAYFTMKIVVFLTMSLLFSINHLSTAQRGSVSSGAYNLLLKTLLTHTVPEVSVADLTLSHGTLLLDAREKPEYQVSHIANAILVGYDKLDLSTLKNVDKHKPIIVYCSVGYRSEKVAEKLISQGFTNVKNLYGGIFEWKNEGKEVINDQGITENVHAFSRTWGIWLKKGNKVY
jgi:rhodanese-related sulfurtransferase